MHGFHDTPVVTKTSNTTAKSVQYRSVSPTKSETTSGGSFIVGGGSTEDITIVPISTTPDEYEQKPPGKFASIWQWLAIILVLLLAACAVVAVIGSENPLSLSWMHGAAKNVQHNCNASDVEVHGGAVTGRKECTEIAVDIMRHKNGSAVDAAIASMLCLEALHPHSTGISGGGFLLLFNPTNNNDVKAYDFRETVPANLINSLQWAGSNISEAKQNAFNIGIPGMLRGFNAAHKAYGKLAWADLFAPTISLMRNGFPVTQRLAHSVKNFRVGRYKNEALEKFLNISSVEGQIIRRPQLADVYERIAQFGAEDFYTGQLAQQFVDEVQRVGGVITLDDMRNYEIRMREPIAMQMENGIEFFTIPAPSSGTALVFAMKMLQKFNKLEKDADEATQLHFVVETMKLMFLLRTRLGDPQFASAAVRSAEVEMMSDETVERLYSAVNMSHILSTPEEYYRATRIPYDARGGKPDQGTSGSVFIDNDGLIVSTVHSINSAFGAGIMSEKMGLIFNDELDDFGTATTIEGKHTSDEQQAAEYVANQLETDKRPLSSMIPVIFHTPKHLCGLRGATAGEGGARILSTNIQVLWRVLLRGQTLEEAIEGPRVLVYRPHLKVLVDRPLPEDVFTALAKTKGQNIAYEDAFWMSTLNAVIKINDTLTGEADSRRHAVEQVYKR